MNEVDTEAVRSFLVETYPTVVERITDCAVATAAATDELDTSAVRQGIEATLRECGVWELLPRVLTACVEFVGGSLRASPVAAAPYVVATATGVVLRATLSGGRLVISVDGLVVDREPGSGTTLRPHPDAAGRVDAVDVEWRT